MKNRLHGYISKKRLGVTFFLFLCFFSLFIPAVLTAESLQCDLAAGGYRLAGSAAQGYTIVMADAGYGGLHSPGDPALPQKIIELKVPQEGVIGNIELTMDGTRVETLPLAYNIVPGAPAMSDKNEYWGEGKSIVNGKNMYVYGKDAFFPGKTVELLPVVAKKESASVGGRKYRLARYIRIAFRPFAYNPVTRELKLTKTASVTVTYTVAAMKTVAPAAAAAPADYVIITTNEIVSGSTMLQSFVNMKNATGHTVRIVTEDEYGSLAGQAPNGTAEKIRQWLIENYLALGIDYVLLIGDPTPADPLNNTRVGDVPMKMCYPLLHAWQDREGPTDFFYANLEGDWDLDGDGIFGEDLPVDHPTSPAPAVGPDVFSARWTGKIQFDVSSVYYLCPNSSDGVRIYLDGDPTPWYENWTDHSPLYRESDPYTATAGLHDITVEYYKNSTNGVMQLYWYSFDCGLEKAVIPADHLFHYDAATGTYVPGGLDAAYYNSIDLSGSPAYSDVRAVNDIWMTGDNGSGGRQTQAQVCVGRIPVYWRDYYSLDQILAKIIAYETDPGDLDWRKSVLLPAYPLDSLTPGYPLGEAVKTNVTDPLGYKSFRIYNQDYAPGGPTPELWPCNVDNVVGEWLNHYGMVTWFTHGNEGSANHIIGASDVDTLDDDYPAFTFQASCTTGMPESSGNLGYSLLRHGAVTTVSASRSPLYGSGSTSVTDPTSTMCEDAAYFYTYFVMSNGGAPMAAGDALNEYRSHLTSLGREVIVFNVYGDPDCRLLSSNPRQRPVPEAGGPYAGTEGERVVLNAAGSYDPEGGAIEYRWDTDGDGVFDTVWSPVPSYTIDHCTNSAVISVQVRNDWGCVATDIAGLTVENVPPIAEAGPDMAAIVNENVTFHGSATDPGDDVDSTSFEWDFGDGTPPVVSDEPFHMFTATGTYTVTLTVRDKNGGEDSDTLTCRVFGVSPLSNENPARPWTKVQGNFILTDDTVIKSEKTLSLKFEGTGYMVAATPVFASSELAGYSNRLSLDIYMPSPATNPSWLGQVQLIVNCPSANMYWQIVDQVELNGLSLDTWNTIAFTLSPPFVSLFSGSHDDIQIQIAVNTNQAAGNPYRIDDLRFTGSIVVPPPAPAVNRLENVWSATTATPTYLTLNSASEDAPFYCQTLHTDWTSQQWVMEPVPGFPDRVRLKCAWNSGGTDYYLTATGTSGSGEGDPVVGKALRADWASQVWIAEPGRGGSTRFKSAWSMSTYLTVKSADSFSKVVCQPNHPEWSSQEWNIK